MPASKQQREAAKLRRAEARKARRQKDLKEAIRLMLGEHLAKQSRKNG